MRTAFLFILYATVLVLSAATVVAIHHGLRPPLLWDGRARLYAALSCFLLALLSGVGLGSLIGPDRLPRRLRFVPMNVGAFVALFSLSLLQDLPSRFTAADVATKLGLGILSGGIVGSALAFSSSLDASEKPPEPSLRSSRHLPLALLLVGVMAFGLLVWPRARDDGRYSTAEQFQSGEAVLTLGYSEGPFGFRTAIVRVTDRNLDQAAVLDRQDSMEFEQLMLRAEGGQSESWRLIDAMSDGGGPPTRIEVSAGPGITVRMSSDEGAPVAFVIAPADFQRLNAALDRIAAELK